MSEDRPIIDNRIAAVIACCLVLILGGQAYQIQQTGDQASDAAKIAQLGVEAHIADCGLKAYYAAGIRQSQTFLKLPQADRVRLYGPIADVPDAIIKSGLVKQQVLFAKFSALDCSDTRR